MPHFPGCRVSGSSPPMSSQDPDIPQYCAPSPASLEMASFASVLPARPPPKSGLQSLHCTEEVSQKPGHPQDRKGSLPRAEEWPGRRGCGLSLPLPIALTCLPGINLGQGQAGFGVAKERSEGQLQDAFSSCHDQCSRLRGHVRSWKFRWVPGAGLKAGPLKGSLG